MIALRIHSMTATSAGLGLTALAISLFATGPSRGQGPGLEDLDKIHSGHTRAENALWIENPLSSRFNASKRVVVADLKGPAVITMIHFAVPASQVSEPIRRLDRDLVLRMFWDEDPMFRREFSRRGNTLQFSSTVYWYQQEPHAPLPALPAPAERTPAPDQPFWPDKELGPAQQP